jgi:hypothetical protein
MVGTSHARRRLYVVESVPDQHPDQHNAGDHEPQQSESEIADLDARLTGMSMLLRMASRFMRSYDASPTRSRK